MSRGRAAFAYLLTCAVLLLGVSFADARAQSAEVPDATVESEVESEARVEAAVDVLRAFMDSTRVPGLSGAIAVDGTVQWTGGFGYANLQHQVPAGAETRYRIASISKPIAATTAMTLVEDGRLDLDAPIRSYLPLFPKKEKGVITTRQLLSHTAGIRHYRGEEFRSDTRYESRIGPLAIFADDSLRFEPGTDFSYSTYGYTLASAVIEAAADTSFLELMDARIAEPLGLRSLVPEKTEQVIPNEASFYLVERTPDDTTVVNAPYVDNSNKWAGGGLLATPGDVVRFVLGLLDGQIVDAEYRQMMFAEQGPIDDEPAHYGLGWVVVTDEAGRRRIMHTGGAMGGSGVVLFYPKQEIVIATLANAGDVPHAELAMRMADLLLDGEEDAP
jgi:CubicO group peptidase (beta-lactamase class C family)